MPDDRTRRAVTKSVGGALLASIAVSASSAGQSGTGGRRAAPEGRLVDRLEDVHDAYGISTEQRRFAAGDLPHFLAGTPLADDSVIAVPEGIEPPDEAQYDVVLTSDEHRRIVDRARTSYRRRYGVDPRSPSVRRFGDVFLPEAFVRDLYDDVVGGEPALEGGFDVETIAGRSRAALREDLREGAPAAVCRCGASGEGDDRSRIDPPDNPRRPPSVGETSPTVAGDELVLHVYAPVSSSALYPDADVWSAATDAFERFGDDRVDGADPEETRVVYVHGAYEPPSSRDSVAQLEAFAEFAYGRAAAGDEPCADERNTLATLWVDEMENRGIARRPGFYSVCAANSTERLNLDALWTNAGILQHEIGHNFGCYRSASVGHDDDEPHHGWADVTNCVMHYGSQRFTSEFCSHCNDVIARGLAGEKSVD